MAEQDSKSMNIYQKLAKIRKQVEVIQKDKAGYGYKYVSEDEILARISAFMDKYSLSLIPSIKPGTLKVEPYHTLKTKANKGGDIYEEHVNDVIVSADMLFSWVNNDKPEERIDVPWIVVGQQGDSSQSFGSGLSYSMRYFLLKFFNIATPDDDPDKWRSKQKAAGVAADKMVAEQIIKTFDELVRRYLADNPGKNDDVKKFASKYAKSGNYFSITESVVASKMLADFKETFGIKEE